MGDMIDVEFSADEPSIEVHVGAQVFQLTHGQVERLPDVCESAMTFFNLGYRWALYDVREALKMDGLDDVVALLSRYFKWEDAPHD